VSKRDDQKIVERAVGLSIVEVVLGSILHSLKIPFSGQFLSLNQGLFLTRSLDQKLSRFQNAKAVLEISMVVAIMKSLSPAGKKLGPMISISMQGFLYMLGVLLFGSNLIAQMISMVLLSIWAFCQPLVTYFLMYGDDLPKALQYFFSKFPVTLSVLILIVSIKFILAALIPIINKYFSGVIQKYDEKLDRVPEFKRDTETPALRGTIRDMTRPFFILSVVLMICFFVLTGSSTAVVFWKTLRALAIAFLFFFLTRSSHFKKILMKLSNQSKYLQRLFDLSQKAYNRLIS
jgi:hypothetical protein